MATTERRESRNLTALCGVRLTAAELKRGTEYAKAIGMTLPALLRSMLQDLLGNTQEVGRGD